MDYTHPVESLIPGVQGRVLGVLSRTDVELTMRTVAELAGVSVNRAVAVLNELVSLGVVERREAGSAALVRIAKDNEAAYTILTLSRLFDRVVDRLHREASRIRPAPASVMIFGSFARGEAEAESDVDVLVVRPDEIGADDDSWNSAIASWTDIARRITGNPINLIEVGVDELPSLLKRRGSLWQNIKNDARTLVGPNLEDLERTSRR